MDRPIFSLQQAREMLPHIKHLTAEAVRRAESLASQIQSVGEEDPAHAQLSGALNDVLTGWADEVRALGPEVKGLWLVDFDNGEGYYCWCYPEETIGHFHGYEEGFAGRVGIH
jgi:hypothetical protein